MHFQDEKCVSLPKNKNNKKTLPRPDSVFGKECIYMFVGTVHMVRTVDLMAAKFVRSLYSRN